PASPAIYTLSLHDALPILAALRPSCRIALRQRSGAGPIDGSGRKKQPSLLIAVAQRGGVDDHAGPEHLSGPRIDNLPRLSVASADRKSTRLNSSHVAISYA